MEIWNAVGLKAWGARTGGDIYEAQKKMILNKTRLFLCISLILFCSCQGTHGEIQSYKINKSKAKTEKVLKRVCSDFKELNYFDNTDESGLNRPGYADISIEYKGVTTYYKIHYRGDEQTWIKDSSYSQFAIIEINGTLNKSFGLFSKEKRRAISLFDLKIIARLEKELGIITKEL